MNTRPITGSAPVKESATGVSTSSTSRPSAVAPEQPGSPGGRAARILLVAGVLAALLGGGWLMWVHVFRDWFYPHDWGVVVPGKVYRSGQISNHLIRRTLTEHHVGVIVSMSGDEPRTADVLEEIRLAAELGIPRVDCNLKGDGTGNPRRYARAVEAVVQAGRDDKVVLIHCQAGAQRTSGVVAYYRVLVQRRPPGEAYAEMLRYGHDPRSNPKLAPYLNQHMAEVAEQLVERKVIDTAPQPLPILAP